MSTASPAVSGYVFNDKNNDGKYEASESPVAGSKVELLNAKGAVVGTSVTNAQGFYDFTTNATVSTATKSITQTLVLPAGYTNLNNVAFSSALQLFNPSLGTLVDVKVKSVASLSSTLQGENTSLTATADLQGSVSGSYQINGLGQPVAGTLAASSPDFHASTFDGTLDYAGTSGVTFSLTPSDTKTETLTTSSQLAAFTATAGQTTLTPSATIQASIEETGGSGNTRYMAATKGSAVVTITFDYTPSNLLGPGQYTIVPLPTANFVQGKASSPTGMVLNNQAGTRVIALNLTGTGATQNDFGLIPVPRSSTTKPATAGIQVAAVAPTTLPNQVTITTHPTGQAALGFFSLGFQNARFQL